MKIIFLSSSSDDLRWFKRYYVSVFPQGRKKADKHYLNALSVLRKNPHIGHPSENFPMAREYDVTRTPFSFIYRVKQDHIEIIRVIDNRSNWDQQVLQAE